MARDDVVRLYREGVAAIPAAVRGWPPERWDRPVCGRWRATDLAGHLVCVVGWYHRWLDRAESGDASPPFGEDELDARNDEALAALRRPAGGEDRITVFVEEAERYIERLDSSWALPYGFPLGTATAGAHAAIAALEWHLHAWDLSGGRHCPSDPVALLAAAGRAVGAARGTTRARIEGRLAPVIALRRPWERTLRWSGRDPHA